LIISTTQRIVAIIFTGISNKDIKPKNGIAKVKTLEVIFKIKIGRKIIVDCMA
jgi:hypothetical protein